MMQDGKRTRYDPVADMAARWHGWRVHDTRLAGLPEVICDQEKLVLIDPEVWPEGRDWAVAHCLAHLDLGHHLTPGSRFTYEQEDLADWQAQIRMEEP